MKKHNAVSRKRNISADRQLELPKLIMVAGSSEVRSMFKQKRMVSTRNYIRKTGTGILYAVYNGRNPEDRRECCWQIMFAEQAS